MIQARTISGRLVRWVLLLALIVSATPASLQIALAAPASLPAAAPTNVFKLNVVSARAAGGHTLGEAVTQYKFLINEDDTGTPNDSTTNCLPATNPSLAGCQWPSIHKMTGIAPIVTQGTEADLVSGLDLSAYVTAHPGATKFLVSVVADGFKVGGQHFALPLDSASNTLTVELEPNPLPTTTFRAMVFNDNASPNGAIDVPGEDGLDGFQARLDDITIHCRQQITDVTLISARAVEREMDMTRLVRDRVGDEGVPALAHILRKVGRSQRRQRHRDSHRHLRFLDFATRCSWLPSPIAGQVPIS